MIIFCVSSIVEILANRRNELFFRLHEPCDVSILFMLEDSFSNQLKHPDENDDDVRTGYNAGQFNNT